MLLWPAQLASSSTAQHFAYQDTHDMSRLLKLGLVHQGSKSDPQLSEAHRLSLAVQQPCALQAYKGSDSASAAV